MTQEIILIKSKPEPMKLTAKPKLRTLKDHYEAFMSINNLKPVPESEESITFLKVFENFFRHRQVKVSYFHEFISICEAFLANSSGKKKGKFKKRLLANLLGYEDTTAMYADNNIAQDRIHLEGDKLITNLRYLNGVEMVERFCKPENEFKSLLALIKKFREGQSNVLDDFPKVKEIIIQVLAAESWKVVSLKSYAKKLVRSQEIILSHKDALNILAACLDHEDWTSLVQMTTLHQGTSEDGFYIQKKV